MWSLRSIFSRLSEPANKPIESFRDQEQLTRWVHTWHGTETGTEVARIMAEREKSGTPAAELLLVQSTRSMVAEAKKIVEAREQSAAPKRPRGTIFRSVAPSLCPES